jgi:hypothetical protein
VEVVAVTGASAPFVALAVDAPASDGSNFGIFTDLKLGRTDSPTESRLCSDHPGQRNRPDFGRTQRR